LLERERERERRNKKKEKERGLAGGTFKRSKGLTAMIVLPMLAFGFFAA